LLDVVLSRRKGGWDPKDSLVQYLARAGQWFIMAYVARVLPVEMQGSRVVRGPGTKFDYMLILEGQQGVGKSTVAGVLGGEHYADTGLTIGEKDTYQNIQGIHVYEWAELDNMARAEVSKVKAFVSSKKDRFRASFDRRPRDYPRQVVFVGTVNEDHYLTDPTGNRRYWPVRCTRETDVQWLSENLDQMVAEAIQLLDDGERFWPSREEQRDLFDPQQQSRVVPNSLEAAIREYLYDENQRVPHGSDNGTLVNSIGLKDLLQRVGYTLDKQTAPINKQASAIMQRLGWPLQRASGKSGTARPYYYTRPESAHPARASQASIPTAQPQGTEASEAERDDIPF
jgi:putative DNA primase/helicase